MNPTILPTAVQPPILLDINLVIDQQQALRQTLRRERGGSTRAIKMRIDPSMDLVFLSEVTLAKTLPCLRRLAQPGTTGVWLRGAHLECPRPTPNAGRSVSSLAVLESGSCFLMADDQKIPIATFVNEDADPAHVVMDLLQPTNLLDFLLAETFTVEISGVNRRRLAHPLALSLALEFDTQLPVRFASTSQRRRHFSAAT